MHWSQAFFGGGGTRIERFFKLNAYLRTGDVIEIGTDASPWGLGGWLAVNGTITHFFASQLSEDDTSIFNEPIASANGQQLWESLAILVAIEIWASQWTQSRVVLKVRGDNVGALTLLIKMRPANSKQAIIVRGLALRLIDFF